IASNQEWRGRRAAAGSSSFHEKLGGRGSPPSLLGGGAAAPPAPPLTALEIGRGSWGGRGGGCAGGVWGVEMEGRERGGGVSSDSRCVFDIFFFFQGRGGNRVWVGDGSPEVGSSDLPPQPRRGGSRGLRRSRLPSTRWARAAPPAIPGWRRSRPPPWRPRSGP